MPKGIILLGPSGSGKTTLGKLVAERLGTAFLDIDDYIWKKDTEIPYTVMYTKAEKISRLMEAAEKAGEFVMAGSMNSFHEHFDPFFLLAVYLTAEEKLRVSRIHDRELAEFGSRILPGGDMFEAHQAFLRDSADYDHGAASCSSKQHELWLSQLTCPVLRLDGGEKLEKNAGIIIAAYEKEHVQ
ncbi:MAG TPA: AAA family ATPase [Candidatus Eisenbergiella intestinipullorum]|nr:AAA family ATPase [Candidatus Eisenbergiella intestinipullorum]